MFLTCYLESHAEDSKDHVHDEFVAVWQPKCSSATESSVSVLSFVDVTDSNNLVGFGYDGINTYIAAHGTRGESVPLVITFWCFAHCLELSLKDALKDTLFSVTD